MNIDEMTIGQAKELAKLFGNNDTYVPTKHGAIGKKCVVRTYASGVHFGEVVSVGNNDGRSRCELRNSRRLWFWKVEKGISLSAVAKFGITKESKVCVTIPTLFVEDAIEFLPATDEAIKTIENAEVYNA